MASELQPIFLRSDPDVDIPAGGVPHTLANLVEARVPAEALNDSSNIEAIKTLLREQRTRLLQHYGIDGARITWQEAWFQGETFPDLRGTPVPTKLDW